MDEKLRILRIQKWEYGILEFKIFISVSKNPDGFHGWKNKDSEDSWMETWDSEIKNFYLGFGGFIWVSWMKN
uniref:Uncharacterized protein n=1 Tax=Strongyloides papillosus TaxID=174720 RepID=A0A0N5C3Z0_STREA